MLDTKTMMKLEHFHDFYFLEAIKAALVFAKAGNPELAFSHSIERLENDIDALEFEILPNIALRTFVYLYAACFGEARHAREEQAETRYLVDTTKKHRGDCYSMITEYAPTRENINALVDIFSKQKWSRAFGGEAWGNIAKALHMYGKIPDAAFVDHVIDLEHNGGNVFNKDDAKATLWFNVSYEGGFSKFLSYKFAKNILVDTPYDNGLGYLYVSRPVYRMIERYCTIMRQKLPSHVRPGLKTLREYNVIWGEMKFTTREKWYPWVNILNGSEPNAQAIFNLSKVDDIYPPSETAATLTKKVKGCIKKAWSKLPKQYRTKVLRQELDKLTSNWLEWGLKVVKKEKKPVTYEILPCKVKKESFQVILQFPVEFQGDGEKTDYGWTLTIKHLLPTPEAKENGFDGTPGFSDGYLALVYGKVQIHFDDKKFAIVNTVLEAYLS